MKVPTRQVQTLQVHSEAAVKEGCSDLQMLAAAREGDPKAAEMLLHKHRGLARAKAGSYFAPGATQDDILQEAMIGLFKAIRSYDISSGVPFTAFARMCIKRHLDTTVKNATRMKQKALNTALSINGVGTWSQVADKPREIDLRDQALRDPVEILMTAEELENVKQLLLAGLTHLESEVAGLLVQGKSYAEIAELIGSHVKGVDNAIQRLRRKLRKSIKEQDEALKVRDR